jgi:mannose-6-phosphate isomerase-like protein (cupin superfamily)
MGAPPPIAAAAAMLPGYPGDVSEKVNLAQAFASFDETWSPRVAAEIDDFAVKLVKLEGEFVWHHHDDADELFLVVEGRLVLRFRDRDDVELGAGELYVVPRGVEHLPVAEPGCQVLLLERAEVVNTGSAGGERTAAAKRL